MIKPKHQSGYLTQHTTIVRKTCLYLATKLADVMDDLVIVGGMVPSLLIPQNELPPGVDRHCGTLDIDYGLAAALFEGKRYQGLTERLRGAGFEPDRNNEGRLITQRWRLTEHPDMTIDFLVEPSSGDKGRKAGSLRNIEEDFAAILTPGLHLAFDDRQVVSLTGQTVHRETATRAVSVCGPAGFIALKALAFNNRGENKDAFDLFYVLKNYGNGVSDVVERFRRLKPHTELNRAFEIICRDFATEDSVGPRRVSEFIHAEPDDETLADVVSFVTRLLTELGVAGY